MEVYGAQNELSMALLGRPLRCPKAMYNENYIDFRTQHLLTSRQPLAFNSISVVELAGCDGNVRHMACEASENVRERG